MQYNRNSPTYLVQLVDLFLMELTNWRWSWQMMLLTSTITPMLSIVGLGLFVHNGGKETLIYILTGNIVLSLMFGNMDKVQSRFSFMRITGTLDYFATLPVQRSLLILAILLSFLLLSLPSFVLTLLFGSFFLGLPIILSPLIILIIPLCAIPLATIGALIGVTSRSPQEAGSISLLLTLLMVAIGPVIIPADRLPGFMLILGRISPATYAASALRQALLGPLTGEIFIDIAVLATMTCVALWIVGRKLDWRQK